MKKYPISSCLRPLTVTTDHSWPINNNQTRQIDIQSKQQLPTHWPRPNLPTRGHALSWPIKLPTLDQTTTTTTNQPTNRFIQTTNWFIPYMSLWPIKQSPLSNSILTNQNQQPIKKNTTTLLAAYPLTTPMHTPDQLNCHTLDQTSINIQQLILHVLSCTIKSTPLVKYCPLLKNT